MHLVFYANEQQKEEFLTVPLPEGITANWEGGATDKADACFDLLFEEEGGRFSAVTGKPVFVNAVITPSAHLPANYIRLNGWKGFLKRPVLEIAAAEGPVRIEAEKLLHTLGRAFKWAPDEAGMISARIVAAIVNEAYFAWGDGVSTKEEIDTAMKLGTNYPWGPFEWAQRIGLHRIYRLLRKLAETDPRYVVAPKLEEEIKSIA